MERTWHASWLCGLGICFMHGLTNTVLLPRIDGGLKTDVIVLFGVRRELIPVKQNSETLISII